MKEYNLKEVLLKDQVKSIRQINYIGIIILGFILSLDLYWYFSSDTYPITFGTFKAAITIVVFAISFRFANSFPYICAFCTIFIVYAAFILFPALPLDTFAAQDIFLLVFMVSLTSSLPYLCYNIKEEKRHILIWQLLIFITTIISIYVSVLKLNHQDYPGLEKVISTNPMLYIATLISISFVHFVVYKSKIKNYELKENISMINAELHKRFKIIENQKDKLHKQKEELDEYHEELRSINNQLENTVKNRTAELEQKNKILFKYGFLNSQLTREPIARLKKHIKSNTENSTDLNSKNSHFKHHLQELEMITNYIRELLNSESVNELEKIEAKILKEYNQ